MQNVTKPQLTADRLNTWMWEVVEETGYLVHAALGGFYLTDPLEEVHGPFPELAGLVDFMEEAELMNLGVREELAEAFSF